MGGKVYTGKKVVPLRKHRFQTGGLNFILFFLYRLVSVVIQTSEQPLFLDSMLLLANTKEVLSF